MRKHALIFILNINYPMLSVYLCLKWEIEKMTSKLRAAVSREMKDSRM